MLKFSTGLRNYMAVTGSLRAGLANTVMKIYSGTEPATADAALGGATLVCTITTGGDGTTPLAWEPTANDGVLLKAAADVWSGLRVAAATAAFFRIETLADAGGTSTTAVRIQGNARQVGGDLNLSALAAAIGAPQLIDNGAIAIPAF